jgi:hypothetical protein
VLLGDRIPEHLGAQDELLPGQEELIAAYYAGDLSRAA